ncbi:hypothetical protein NMY22_g2538 [Coprinellus aureogranulatus]|nr:hypothetical protein NMY22_g2538 [Coprinellus aureogranulatus]
MQHVRLSQKSEVLTNPSSCPAAHLPKFSKCLSRVSCIRSYPFHRLILCKANEYGLGEAFQYRVPGYGVSSDVVEKEPSGADAQALERSSE